MREIDTGLTERQLIKLAADGDPRAIRTLYDRYAPRVYAVVRRIAADDDLAQDYAQEAWVRAIRALPTFRGICVRDVPEEWIVGPRTRLLEIGRDGVGRWRPSRSGRLPFGHPRESQGH